MSRFPLSSEELKKQLSRQLTLLKKHISSFHDLPAVALDIATKVRVLCHDTKSQKSLLTQLGKKDDTQFPDTYSIKSKNNSNAPFCGLVYICLDWSGASFVPKLSGKPVGAVDTPMSFEQWWNTCILRDYEGRELTRKDLVLEIADTDGGAHVDKSLKDTYHFISRMHSLTWKFKKNSLPEVSVAGVELASVCQVGYELLVALDQTYIPPQIPNKGMCGEFAINGNPGQAIFGRPLPFRMEQSTSAPKGHKRNETCDCGSGVKAKRCCPDGIKVAVYMDPV